MKNVEDLPAENNSDSNNNNNTNTGVTPMNISADNLPSNL